MNNQVASPSSNQKFSLSLPSTIRLNEWLNVKEDCDFVTLKVEDKEFRRSRRALSKLSPIFKAMFQDVYKENIMNRVCLNTDGVENMDADVVEKILMYADDQNMEITESISEIILPTADYLLVKGLVLKCLESRKTDSTNCFSDLTKAEVHGCPRKQITGYISYIKKHFSEVCEQPGFLELTPNTMINLLKHDALQVENERKVLDAVIRWFHFKDGRIKDLGRVLEHVRLAHIQPMTHLDDCVKREKILQESEPIQKLLEKVKEYHNFPAARLTNQSSVTRRRFNSPQVETFRIEFQSLARSSRLILSEDGRQFGFSDELGLSDKADTSHYIRWCPHNYQLCCILVKAITSKVHSFMGIIPFDFENECFSLKTPKKVQKTFNFGVAEAYGCWYVVGGCVPEIGVYASNVERYDQAANTWTQLPSLPIPIYIPKVVSMTGLLFVLGNSYPSKKLVMLEYNIDENVWMELPSLQGSLVIHGTPCALNRRVYVLCHSMENNEIRELQTIEGRDASLYEYNADTRTWRTCASTKYVTIGGPILLNGKVCVLSMKCWADKLAVLERYDPALNSWTRCRNLYRMGTSFRNFVSITGPYLMDRHRERKPAVRANSTPKDISQRAREWLRWMLRY